MIYDIYAEFWKNVELNSMFKEWIKVKWESIKNNKNIQQKKPKELRKELEKDIGFFDDIVKDFLHGNEISCPTYYSKLQKVLQHYIEVKRRDLIEFFHFLLSDDIRRYNKRRSDLNKLNLEENPKDAYKEFMGNFKFNDIYKIYQNILTIKIFNSLSRYLISFKIKFILRKPYLSKDNEDFYIIDNPIVKEKVSKIPIIRSTTWKGSLRHISYMLFIDKLRNNRINRKNWIYERSKLVRLFGSEKTNIADYMDFILAKELNIEKSQIEKEFNTFLKVRYKMEKARAGRLVFFTTFLNQINLDVITPLDREKRTPVRGPILFEIVPEGSVGEFKLLYMPFDIINDENRLKKEIREDLEILKEAIPKMMLEYGFSAKKTSGYGVINDEIEFWIDSKLYRYHSTGSLRKGGEFEKRMNELIYKIGEYYAGKQD